MKIYPFVFQFTIILIVSAIALVYCTPVCPPNSYGRWPNCYSKHEHIKTIEHTQTPPDPHAKPYTHASPPDPHATPYTHDPPHLTHPAPAHPAPTRPEKINLSPSNLS
jgi:hypothetical protein